MPQELRFVEMFAGVGNVWRAVSQSYPAARVDLTYYQPDSSDFKQNPMDFLSSAGFASLSPNMETDLGLPKVGFCHLVFFCCLNMFEQMYIRTCIWLLLSCRVNDFCLLMAVVCSTWSSANLGTSKRSIAYATGDCRHACVADGNSMCARHCVCKGQGLGGKRTQMATPCNSHKPMSSIPCILSHHESKGCAISNSLCGFGGNIYAGAAWKLHDGVLRQNGMALQTCACFLVARMKQVQSCLKQQVNPIPVFWDPRSTKSLGGWVTTAQLLRNVINSLPTTSGLESTTGAGSTSKSFGRLTLKPSQHQSVTRMLQENAVGKGQLHSSKLRHFPGSKMFFHEVFC